MRLLLDTNIVLEVVLQQDAAEQARAVLTSTGVHELFISDYSIHSVGLLLFRRGQHAVFRALAEDLSRRAVIPVTLSLGDLG